MKLEHLKNVAVDFAEATPSRSNTRVLLLAAGRAKRWNNYLGVPKYMAPIDGRPLVQIVQDQFAQQGVHDLHLLTARGDEVPEGMTAEVIDPFPDNAPSDKFLSSRALWNPDGPTVLAFADVFFTQPALNEVFATNPNTIRFVGRLTPSSYTGSNHKEIFALSFGPELHTFLETQLRALPIKSSRPAGWMLYRHLQKLCSDPSQPGVVFSHVDDMTEDFDKPEDLQNWLSQRHASRRANIFHRNRRLEKLHILGGMLFGGVATFILALVVLLSL